MSLGLELASPPEDGVSAMRFAPTAENLLVASWDKTLRLYDVTLNVTRHLFRQRGPVLDCCFLDDASAAAGGLDRTLVRYDLVSGRDEIIGSHADAVRCVEALPAAGLLASAGWDRRLNLWDLRLPPGPHRCVAAHELPGKAYSLSAGGLRLAVATSGRHVVVYDLRKLATPGAPPEQLRESSLKYQTRVLRCFPDGSGYALGSVEGRVAMEYFDMAEAAQAKKYAFKCHRQVEPAPPPAAPPGAAPGAAPGAGTQDVVYPVNALAFHPLYGTFASGGGDGVVNVWDGGNKKRLFHFPRYPTSIASLAFSREGTLLAVAASYTHEAGDRPHPPDAIYVREVADAEVRPKPRAVPA